MCDVNVAFLESCLSITGVNIMGVKRDQQTLRLSKSQHLKMNTVHKDALLTTMQCGGHTLNFV